MKLSFIVGTGRCGSTLLHEILAKHAHTSFLSSFEEQHGRFGRLADYSNTVYRGQHLPLVGKVAAKFEPTEAYSLIDRKVSPIYSRPYRDLTRADVTPWLANRFENFFASRYQKYQQPVMVHKYTGWSRLGFFAEIFPEAKFVHVVRDGRAVANSWLQMKWWSGFEGTAKWLWGGLSPDQLSRWHQYGQSYPSLAALCWELLMDSYTSAQLSVERGQFMELRYEDLLDDPRGQLQLILDFLELEWSKDFEKQFNTFDIRQSRKLAYERDLNEDQLAEVEACIAPLLKKYRFKVKGHDSTS